jgi:hypothetical protein
LPVRTLHFVRSPLAQAECMAKVCALLTAEGVTFVVNKTSITSTHTPFAFLGVNRRLYSRLNWVGLNPFVYASSLAITMRASAASGGTDLEIAIDRTRMFALYGVASSVVLMVGTALPAHGLLFATTVGGLVLLLLRYLSGSLIRDEVEKAIAASEAKPARGP